MKTLIPLLLMLVAMPSMAQRQFDIEVIIFNRAVDAEQTDESWPTSVAEIDLEKAAPFNDASYRAKKGVQMLPASEYALNDEVNKLKQHAGFKVLMHKAWRQGDQGRFAAPVFHVQAGRDYSGKFNPDGSMINAQQSQILEGITEQSIPKPLYQLDGKLQIYVEHYLYADVQLDLKAPSVKEVTLEQHQPTTDNLEPAVDNQVVQVGLMEDITPTVHKVEFLKSYRFDQKRRMRSTETHFLDHPLMGMIIQVRRVNQ
ncbi:hypothetical protein TW81_10730 [Vibrio galatheae]|uniref:Peptidoglycan-binding protein CsiV n=1 Tax=Vibrio galatheae TaxID=579748 RepID=A0A0F4NJF8_9VIBR|nr:peptidoglycan binding protein CsiV [Vibrio galatheae]KJY83034.1 hypothetical protein TW81_10730 [Vibrio galatheae]